MSEPTDPDLEGLIEALLLMSTEAMSTETLAEAADAPTATVEAACRRLATFYDETGRGFELRHVGGGWRLWTRPAHADRIAAWILEGQHARLSQAALETLAVIAYLQPVSRSRVSAVRGVNVDGVVRTLLSRGLIAEVDADERGGATLFATTDHFLERMGMESVDELPPIAPHLPTASDLDDELGRLAAGVQTTDSREADAPPAPRGEAPDEQP